MCATHVASLAFCQRVSNHKINDFVAKPGCRRPPRPSAGALGRGPAGATRAAAPPCPKNVVPSTPVCASSVSYRLPTCDFMIVFQSIRTFSHPPSARAGGGTVRRPRSILRTCTLHVQQVRARSISAPARRTHTEVRTHVYSEYLVRIKIGSLEAVSWVGGLGAGGTAGDRQAPVVHGTSLAVVPVGLAC